jgi:hypothetical protein
MIANSEICKLVFGKRNNRVSRKIRFIGLAPDMEYPKAELSKLVPRQQPSYREDRGSILKKQEVKMEIDDLIFDIALNSFDNKKIGDRSETL